MKCPNCQFENPEEMLFCGKCGTKLEIFCPQCKSSNPSDFRFCGKCGHDLREPENALPIDYSEPQNYTPKFLADKILTTRSSIQGERKLVTVLFADVANFTSISEKQVGFFYPSIPTDLFVISSNLTFRATLR